jgi:hypothetical protein
LKKKKYKSAIDLKSARTVGEKKKIKKKSLQPDGLKKK